MTKELEEVYSSRTIDTKKIKKIDLMKKSNYIGRTKKWKTDVRNIWKKLILK